MYMGLASLLEQSDQDLTGKRIGLFSYGSGCVGEFLRDCSAGISIDAAGGSPQEMLQNRSELAINSTKICLIIACLRMEESIPFQSTARVMSLKRINGHKREYESLVESDESGSTG